MILVDAYLSALTERLLNAFGIRLAYVGLQGSYLRGEATEDSDVDVTVLLHHMTKDDLDAYRRILEELGHADRACGFLCDAETFARWNPLECGRLLCDTRDIYGRLADFVPAHTREDHLKFVQTELGNLYHALCHRYVHADAEKNRRKLASHKKELFFLLQDLMYLRTGVFHLQRGDLLAALNAEDLRIYRLLYEEAEQPDYDFDAAFSAVFDWLGATMRSLC